MIKLGPFGAAIPTALQNATAQNAETFERRGRVLTVTFAEQAQPS
jgi:hypothetical protein